MGARTPRGAGEPRRTCIGCRRVAPATELLRVTAGADGTLVMGRDRPGRGAWLCRDSLACVEQAARQRAFSRALRAPVTAAAVEVLRTQVAERARIDGAVCSERPSETGR